jgi:hypothetical protein
LLVPGRASADTVADRAGRLVSVPGRLACFPRGPACSDRALTRSLPTNLLGWLHANRASEREFLLPDVGSRLRPLTRTFDAKFYHVSFRDEQIERVLVGRN